MPRPLSVAPEYLRVLAAWFDQQDANGRFSGPPELQTDLRYWADLIEELTFSG